MLANWIAELMALIPLAVVGGLRLAGHRRVSAWWWIAVAFAVSAGSDELSRHLVQDDRWWPTLVYPVIQTGIIAAVFLERNAALSALALLIIVACACVFALGTKGPDYVLHTVASLGVVWLALFTPDVPTRLRAALLVYFGLGWVAWVVHMQALIVPTWAAYQPMRLVGLLVFSWAMIATPAYFRVVRRRVDNSLYAG